MNRVEELLAKVNDLQRKEEAEKKKIPEWYGFLLR